MKAIETRYLGPTDHRPGRIKADDGDGHSVTISVASINAGCQADHHRFVAESLANAMGWGGKLVGGETKRGYVWVFVS